jgi:hypothetical protein
LTEPGDPANSPSVVLPTDYPDGPLWDSKQAQRSTNEQQEVERGDHRPGVAVAVEPSGRLREGSTVNIVIMASGRED